MAATQSFKSSVYPLHVAGATVPGYAALYALVLNLAVALAGTAALGALGVDRGKDATSDADYGE
jgi:SSS family solute:Na+ symporter